MCTHERRYNVTDGIFKCGKAFCGKPIWQRRRPNTTRNALNTLFSSFSQKAYFSHHLKFLNVVYYTRTVFISHSKWEFKYTHFILCCFITKLIQYFIIWSQPKTQDIGWDTEKKWQRTKTKQRQFKHQQSLTLYQNMVCICSLCVCALEYGAIPRYKNDHNKPCQHTAHTKTTRMRKSF